MALIRAMGKNPTGEKLEKVKKSLNYRNDAFQNTTETSMVVEKEGFFKVFLKFMNKPKNVIPPAILPSIKTDLNNLADNKVSLVWFGHSSYLIKINNKHILVDPVFSGYAAPFKMKSAKNFEGSNIYTVEDLPEIDILLITHDHYDHLDYKTVKKLKNKTKKIVTSLGVASHLEYWGIDKTKIHELDWCGDVEVIDGIKLICTPARHFSGRSFKRSQTLWSSFVLKTKDHSIYIGADSGYDKHFKGIGEEHGPFDLAILECGQYNEMWKDIHMMPEQTVQASIDLNSKCLLPVHWGKFSLSLHPWNEPIERAVKKAEELNFAITTPMIGECMVIGENHPTSKWWRKVTDK